MESFSSDPGDLFIQLYDELDAELQPAEVAGWLGDERVEEIAAWIEGEVVETGQMDPDELEENLALVADEPDALEERKFALLLGLDRALMYAHPQTSTYDRAGLQELASRYRETGRFNTDRTPGALLPRVVFPQRPQETPERIAEAFVSVVRVAEEAWHAAHHVTIPSRSDFGRLDRERGLIVGCVPMMDGLADLVAQVHESERTHFFQLSPSADLATRIPEILESLDASGAQIGVLPELALSDTLLAAWQAGVCEHPPPRPSRLRWLFIGTGPVGGGDPPSNRGVLIDRRTGAELLRQDKIYPFTLTEKMVNEWGLDELFGRRQFEEYMSRGDKITVAESDLGRLIILICEDLARTMHLGTPLLAYSPSLAIAPVFSTPTELYRWEHNHAREYAAHVGTQVVVANSLVVARATGLDGATGSCLAQATGGWEVGETADAIEPYLFRIDIDAAVSALGRVGPGE
jgi:predicted amidohydrolase